MNLLVIPFLPRRSGAGPAAAYVIKANIELYAIAAPTTLTLIPCVANTATNGAVSEATITPVAIFEKKFVTIVHTSTIIKTNTGHGIFENTGPISDVNHALIPRSFDDKAPPNKEKIPTVKMNPQFAPSLKCLLASKIGFPLILIIERITITSTNHAACVIDANFAYQGTVFGIRSNANEYAIPKRKATKYVI